MNQNNETNESVIHLQPAIFQECTEMDQAAYAGCKYFAFRDLRNARISAMERSKRARLIDGSKKKINWPSLLEFVLHGLKYVYPAEPGPICRGVPTAHSAPPICKEIVSNDNDQYVWPSSEGTVRGQAIEPLYSSAPQAALKDPALHQLLALVDALRVGRARERQIASEELQRRIAGPAAASHD